jgi:hypothetical protein
VRLSTSTGRPSGFGRIGVRVGEREGSAGVLVNHKHFL